MSENTSSQPSQNNAAKTALKKHGKRLFLLLLIATLLDHGPVVLLDTLSFSERTARLFPSAAKLLVLTDSALSFIMPLGVQQLYLCCLRDETPTLSDLFIGFQHPQRTAGNELLYTLRMLVVGIICMIPMLICFSDAASAPAGQDISSLFYAGIVFAAMGGIILYSYLLYYLPHRLILLLHPEMNAIESQRHTHSLMINHRWQLFWRLRLPAILSAALIYAPALLAIYHFRDEYPVILCTAAILYLPARMYFNAKTAEYILQLHSAISPGEVAE